MSGARLAGLLLVTFGGLAVVLAAPCTLVGVNVMLIGMRGTEGFAMRLLSTFGVAFVVGLLALGVGLFLVVRERPKDAAKS